MTWHKLRKRFSISVFKNDKFKLEIKNEKIENISP